MARDDDGSLPPPVTAKRPRGRPRKPGALTNAQRQAAYRARQQAAKQSVTVTENAPDPLARECERLREDLAQARHALAAPHARVPGDSEQAALMALARPVPADEVDLGERRVGVVINRREAFSLERLAAHFGVSPRAVLERLLWWADRSAVQSFGDDDAAFYRYMDGVTENRRRRG